ncbi:phage tail spike protein [Alkalihalobacillus hemicellulosilyticus]|uniref:Phage-related protein n=1 Tax=Halalkalibacter hemicellulosilyticusJCM 9152 TaxID=1236971 RepID=W4QMA8_9BACI|nr:phage tail spike protein [Halalkalibacter hemicellulosilyticus]GAE32454.1 phage-related protein [Halalkalibacter hemicellulosilyticusJCM 9152]
MIHITDGQQDNIIGVITPRHIIDNTHRQSLKDTLETFEFTTFADQSFSEYLGKHNRVIIPAEDEGYKEFVINESIKRRNADGLEAEVYASATYLLLKKAKVIDPQTLSEYTPSMYLGWALNGTEWRPGIVEGSGYRTLIIESHTNPYAFLKRVANEFDLELRFRVETNGNRVTGRYVDLLERVGQWQGREVELGKDLQGIRRIEKTDNIYTALRGIGPADEDGTRLEVLVEDEEALQRWGRPNEQGELQHLIDVYELNQIVWK